MWNKHVVDDLNNQGAADLAHSEDVTGKRTIGRYSLLPHHFFSICEFFVGVLTKPDLIQPGEESGWVGVLEGTAHPLKRNVDRTTTLHMILI